MTKKTIAKDPKKSSKKTSVRGKVSKKQACIAILKAILLSMWVGAVIVIAQLAIGFPMLWILGRDNFLQPLPTMIYTALSYIVALLIIIFVTPKITSIKVSFIKKNRKNIISIKKEKPAIISRNDIGLREWPTWTDIGLAPIGYILSLPLAMLFSSIFSLFPWFDAEQAQDIGFSKYLTGSDRIVAFIALVVIAPIAEELIFRGWLYGKMRAKLTEKISNLASIIISTLLVSLLFGAIHGQWNVGVNVFALSLILCVLREITGTTYAGILVHMIKNGLAFYLLYVLGIS